MRMHGKPIRAVLTGFSLIELMIGLALSLLLAMAIGQLFVSSKQNYQFVDNLSRLQENGRFAIGLLVREIRQAGFVGCGTLSPGFVLNNTLDLSDATNFFKWNFAQSVEGFEATGGAWNPTLDNSISNALPLGDIITIRRVVGGSVAVLAHATSSPPGMANVEVSAGHGFTQSDTVVVSDCVSAAIFQVTSNNSSSLQHAVALGKEYPVGEVTRVETTSFYLRAGPGGLSSLYRLQGGVAEELIEAVQDMQIVYGVDANADGTADEYVAANLVGDWSRVVAVRLSLLMMSIKDGLVESAQTYTFNGEQTAASDRRMYRIFNATINLRNRTY